jgi:hypothetical protein
MEPGILFEITVRLFLGRKAYHSASPQRHAASRRRWLLKVVRLMMKKIEPLDTTTRHKQMLMRELEDIHQALRVSDEANWELIYHLFRLTGRLLGFDYVRGARCHTPVYYQTEEQYDTSVILSGDDVMQSYYDKNDALSVRCDVVK